VAAVTDSSPAPSEQEDAPVYAGPLLVADGITVGFGGLLALDGVSMSVDHGEVVGVIGPNGAGKTTLFNIISGFVHPNSGTISYRGTALRRHHPHDLAKLGIARTLQGVGLCPGLTVHENVMLGAEPTLHGDLGSAFLGIWRSSREERTVAARAMAMLDELGAADYARRMPAALPYAIQKRTALARALMAEPQLLLLDEPASGLSEDEMDALGSMVRELTDRMSVLLVEHHMDLVMSVCDRLVVLNFGQVIAEGTPAVIRSSPDVATAYLGDAVHEDAPPSDQATDDA
jgi:branched-chain amino acid transport system ATP-binding protein